MPLERNKFEIVSHVVTDTTAVQKTCGTFSTRTSTFHNFASLRLVSYDDEQRVTFEREALGNEKLHCLCPNLIFIEITHQLQQNNMTSCH